MFYFYLPCFCDIKFHLILLLIYDLYALIGTQTNQPATGGRVCLGRVCCKEAFVSDGFLAVRVFLGWVCRLDGLSWVGLSMYLSSRVVPDVKFSLDPDQAGYPETDSGFHIPRHIVHK